jgi:palmitoyltransferase ZDHHC9/14/18
MLGTCIGLGNYRWFLLLVAIMTILNGLVFGLVKYQYNRDIPNKEDPKIFGGVTFHIDELKFFLLLGISLIGTVAFGLLTIYHFFITSHNLTTNEHIKKYYKVNPFDCGNSFVNWYHCIVSPDRLLPQIDGMVRPTLEASYRELASTNSECVSDFYDY